LRIAYSSSQNAQGLEFAQVHVQRAREEQHRQHALHQHVGEVDGSQQRLFVNTQRIRNAEHIERDYLELQLERDGHPADGRWQAHEAVIQVCQ